MKNIFINLIVYLLLSCVGVIIFFQIRDTNVIMLNDSADYSQPSWRENVAKWKVRSIDTQVVSRHWSNVSPESIARQIEMLSDLGANYVAVAVAYDKVSDLRLWVDEIHKRGMHVWFRSHWNEWEGDDKALPTLSSAEYLSRTREFVLNNRNLFKAGDSFTVAVEPEQAGVGLGKRFANWQEYRVFVLNQISIANDAFKEIGMDKQIFTNWISVNGWVVENAFTTDFVKHLGLITVDHYPEQTKTLGEIDDIQKMVNTMSGDLDRMYAMWKVPVLLGEWGYPIHQEVSDLQQEKLSEEMFKMLSEKKYLIGINYWVHMGNHARLIDDEWGAKLKFRPIANVVKKWFVSNY